MRIDPFQAEAAQAGFVIRSAVKGDVPAMVEIYRRHIEHELGEVGGAGPNAYTEEDVKQRRKSMGKHKLPHLVADTGGVVAGYAYVVSYRKRPAYRFTVKHSIYIHEDMRGMGIGRQLLSALARACAEAGFLQMIGYIDSTNAASINLHQACGFERVGLMRAVGLKNGRWYDSVLMQRSLGPIEEPSTAPWPGSF